MKKLLLLAIALGTLGGCMGYYHGGKCDYQYFIHPNISFTRLAGCPNS